MEQRDHFYHQFGLGVEHLRDKRRHMIVAGFVCQIGKVYGAGWEVGDSTITGKNGGLINMAL